MSVLKKEIDHRMKEKQRAQKNNQLLIGLFVAVSSGLLIGIIASLIAVNL